MTALVTGTDNGIGKSFAAELIRRGHEVVDDGGLKLSDPAALRRFFDNHRTNLVIHCREFSEKSINCIEALSAVCTEKDIPLMLISSSEVFGAVGELSETCRRIPRSDMGHIFFRCENVVAGKCRKFYILRMPQIVFGQGGADDIVLKLVNTALTKKTLTLDNTRKFSAVYTADAAELAVDIAENSAYGVYHCVNTEECTLFGFACETFRCMRLAGHDSFCGVTVNPFESGGNGVILLSENLARTNIEPLYTWQDALARYTKTIRK